MFVLTPQERSVLAWLLTICLVGTLVTIGLKKDAKIVRWVNTARLAHPNAPVSINTATSQELDKVPGIGPKTAANIIAARKAEGPFRSLDDLRRVKGITKKNFSRITGHLRL
ncbi:MAG: helix-hairpin-helix domain-containing protein [Candidatus Omnitrophica bacterium]|nr:helix-hairpin-helix domain-containing protein [Candidatus Omnitrophota bacterium]